MMGRCVTVLALDDGTKFSLTLLLGVWNTLLSGGITVVLFWITKTVKRYDRLEDDGKAKLKDMANSLHEASTKLIDERFRAITHQVNGTANKFDLAVEDIKQRLQLGDGELRMLGSVDQKIEIQLIERIAVMKDWFVQNLASKGDLKEHEKSVGAKFDRMGERMETLAKEVAVLTDRAERQS